MEKASFKTTNLGVLLVGFETIRLATPTKAQERTSLLGRDNSDARETTDTELLRLYPHATSNKKKWGSRITKPHIEAELSTRGYVCDGKKWRKPKVTPQVAE